MEDPVRSCNPDRTILAELEMSMSICGFFEKHIPAQIFSLGTPRGALDESRNENLRLFSIRFTTTCRYSHAHRRITSKPGNSESPDLRQLGHMVPKFQLVSRDVPDRLGPQRYPFTALPGERVLNMASNWGRYGADTTMSNQSALYTTHIDDEFT